MTTSTRKIQTFRIAFYFLVVTSTVAKEHHVRKHHRIDAALHRSDRWHRKSRPLLASEGFIYVYDLPARFNKDSLQLELSWHSDQYDYDILMHEYLLTSPLRTHNPAEARLFFMPLYLSRQMNWFWQRTDREVKNFWTDAWIAAQNHSSYILLDAISFVKDNYPYWNRLNGRDHFTVFSFDHGRCDLAASLSLQQLGGLFAVQSFGDLAARADGSPSWARDMSENYTWSGATSWACVRPDMDIIVPMYMQYTHADIVPPSKGPRPISALLRFEVKFGDGKNLMAIHGHRLRQELLQLWNESSLPNSAVGPRSLQETEKDMTRSVFCICPPGNTQV
eukprot:jgi/Botrbrau1/23115/Bobra.0243s0047.2